MNEFNSKIYKLKQIETPRLIIRPVQLGDEFPLNKAVNNSLELLQKWEPWAKDSSIEATRGFVGRGVFAWESCSIVDFPMVVIHKQDQKIIAASGYNDRSDINQGLYEIGYWCDIDYQGQGLVTEYANALTKYAFKVLNANKVVLSIQVENKKSIAVSERLNFTNEGIRERDPLDHASEYPEKNHIYSVNNVDNLPPIEASWLHEEHNGENAKIIAWAKETLRITNDKVFASSKAIVKTPWSYVVCFETSDGYIYLKHTPNLLALEASIIQILHDQFHASVPKIIAYNAKLNSFLMKDAGRPLREILKQQFDAALLCKAIDQFTSLQLTVSDHINIFLDIGVPDWRLDKLPDLYKQLLSQKDVLIADGLSEIEISELEALLPKIFNLCKKLSHYAIKQTIVQCDFHDNNILIDDVSQDITFIDLGEIVISHPFFSLAGCLRQIKKHHALTDDDDKYLQIRDAWLKNYMVFESKKQLLDAFSIARKLWFVYEILAQYRLMIACGQARLMSFQHGKLSGSLREFMTVCIATDEP